MSTDANESDIRSLASAAARWACRDSHVSPGDERYRAVTQGRHEYYDRVGVFYSSCGDLGHFVRWAVGIRTRVNRATEPVPHALPDRTLSGWRWLGAENVAWLCAPGNPLARPMAPDSRAEPGDVLVVDDGVDDPARKNHSRTHVIVVLEDRGSTMTTAEYGQPGGAVRQPVVAVRFGRRWVGERRVISWLPLWAEYQADAAAGKLGPALDLETLATPAPAQPSEPPCPVVTSVSAPYVTGRTAELAQRRLQAEGYDVGPIDGIAGRRTAQALIARAWRELAR